MNPLTYSSIRFSLLLMIMIFMAKLHAHEAKPVDEETMMDSNDSEYENDVEKINRDYDLKKLRHFLLTANAAKLAARRKQHDLIKKELIKEYLESLSDPNTERFQEVKKRFKTYCNSYEDLMNSNWAACG